MGRFRMLHAPLEVWLGSVVLNDPCSLLRFTRVSHPNALSDPVFQPRLGSVKVT